MSFYIPCQHCGKELPDTWNWFYVINADLEYVRLVYQNIRASTLLVGINVVAALLGR